MTYFVTLEPLCGHLPPIPSCQPVSQSVSQSVSWLHSSVWLFCMCSKHREQYEAAPTLKKPCFLFCLCVCTVCLRRPKGPAGGHMWFWIFSMCFTDCGCDRVAPGGVWVVSRSVRLLCAYRAKDSRHKLLTMLSLFSELCFSSSSSFFSHYFTLFSLILEKKVWKGSYLSHWINCAATVRSLLLFLTVFTVCLIFSSWDRNILWPLWMLLYCFYLFIVNLVVHNLKNQINEDLSPSY